MKSTRGKFKNRVINLRKTGNTYSEICKILKRNIPKSTISYWCKNILLSKSQRNRIEQVVKTNINKGRAIALIINKRKRIKYLQSIKQRISHLPKMMKNRDVAKIALAMLYLGEGSKKTKGSVVFGNSDPRIINVFMRLLRYCYNIHKSKFRCTVQCRADQDIHKLERFWSKITRIPPSQFYKTRVDPRTIGKPSNKLDYKGVCKIDYFSADLFNELMLIGTIIATGPMA